VTENVLPPAVTVPLREFVDVFGATVYATLPLPLPVAPLVIASHDLLLDAVHAQPVAAVTLMVPLPPAATTLAEVGEIAGEHAAPAWDTVKVKPAIVSVPLRLDVVAFAAMVNATVPEPDPDAPDVIVIHDALLVAVHAHPAASVRVLLPVPPEAAIDWDVGEMTGVQGWLNANVFDRALVAEPPGPTADTADS
jgi:hypothetical protein